MNRIEYESYLFTDETITNGKVYLSNSMSFDALDVDTLNIEVISYDLGNRRVFTSEKYVYCTSNGESYVILGNDIRAYKYGDSITYYHNDKLIGKFYLQNVVRKSKNLFSINAISAVGLWNEMTYLGGVYNGITVRDLVNDILPNFNIDIAPNVANVPLYGWIRVQSVTLSICEILFATGASLLKDSNGNPKIAYLENLPTIDIPDDHIYIGGSVDYRAPATTVNVTEHAFYASINDSTVTLFDNTDGSGSVENKLITFEKPCYDLMWNGETIPSTWKNGANYCYVSGTGVLTGKEYTHTTKVFTADTGATSEPKEVWVKNATLVSVTNSANVAARVIDYRSRAEEVAFGIVIDDERVKPGTKVAFTDPYGDETIGIVEDMDIVMSNTLKANSRIIKGYTPGHFGNNFENVQLFTTNGTWTVPAGKENVRLVIAQGGQAGQNGFNGGNSWADTWSGSDMGSGEGGQPGNPGEAGKVLVIDLHNPTGTFSITIGQGGQPAEGEGVQGNYGTHSTVTANGVTYTSESGAVLSEGYRDVISGNTYAITGRKGINGGKGRTYNDKTCGDVTYEGTTWLAGVNKNNVRKSHETSTKEWNSYGSYGSGAAYGANGLDGIEPPDYDSAAPSVHGADALSYQVTIELASAGWGGHGGGGASCPGYYRKESWSKNSDGSYTKTGDRYYPGSTARGGYHSKGTPGGNGFVLIYS